MQAAFLFLHAEVFVYAWQRYPVGLVTFSYLKRTLCGLKFCGFFLLSFFFLFTLVHNVLFSWKQMIISLFKVYSFIKTLPVAVAGDWKHSAQLNKIVLTQKSCWSSSVSTHWVKQMLKVHYLIIRGGLFIHTLAYHMVIKLFQTSRILW